jgi:D-proline reductase (dithiol) PrdB
MPNERTVDSWRFAGSMLAKMLDPVDRLRELVSEGHVGAIADSHYSIMGFQGSDSSRLVEESAPAIADAMKSEEVDLALFAPV